MVVDQGSVSFFCIQLASYPIPFVKDHLVVGIWLNFGVYYFVPFVSVSLFFFRQNFALVSQAGVQWYGLCSLQPLPPGSSDSLASAF